MKQERGVTFDLKYLPAYSPNLNLIERLWKFLRKEALQKWHATFEDMQQAVAEVLDNLDRYQERVGFVDDGAFSSEPAYRDGGGGGGPGRVGKPTRQGVRLHLPPRRQEADSTRLGYAPHSDSLRSPLARKNSLRLCIVFSQPFFCSPSPLS